MAEDLIKYEELIDEAMYVIVQKALNLAATKGLPGDHHFFISFRTDFPGAELSKTLRNQYPEEMTIVLQYQFYNLKVEDRGFGVTLSFGGVREPLYIPYKAITAFADPSVKFGLQFRHMGDDNDYDDYEYDDDDLMEEIAEFVSEDGTFQLELEDDLQDDTPPPTKTGGRKKGTVKDKSKSGNNVVSLDQFRKK